MAPPPQDNPGGMPVLSTAERDATPDLIEGYRSYNPKYKGHDTYDGSAWWGEVRTSKADGYELNRAMDAGTTLHTGFYRVQTVDSTPTTVLNYTMNENSFISIEATVFAGKDDYGAGYFAAKFSGFRRQVGNAIRIGPPVGFGTSGNDFSASPPNINFIENGLGFDIEVIGSSVDTIEWALYIRLFENSQ